MLPPISVALHANPTVLEVLWSPLVEAVTADGQQLLATCSSNLNALQDLVVRTRLG